MKLNFKKIFLHTVWLFVIGCIFGFIFETIWHLIKNGELINKQGLLYGPFKPIYGLGLVLVTAFLIKQKDKSPVTIFILGIVIGTIFEYAASIFQEVVFGTYTWNYTNFNLNLNGRIYLPYCIVWGVIAYLWIKYGWNLYLKLFNKFQGKIFNIISIIVCIFMIINIILTALASFRYAQRVNGELPSTVIGEKIDIHYSDEVIAEKFPKLRVIPS